MKMRTVLMGLCLGAGLWVGCHPIPQVADSPRVADGPKPGQVIFQENCAACHGSTGKGDGSSRFNPSVADLTSAKVYTQLTPQLIRTVHEGRANTAMGTWKNVLSDRNIEDVVAYLRSLRGSSDSR
ncbi:MAG: cytochrome c [Nitrospirota bacterium]|nr:cytochrome c [Nitrospirota bacterium]